MKLILKEDVKNVGRLGDVVNVSDGYGRNYLLPKKLALVATASNVQRLEQEMRSKKGQARRQVMDARSAAETISAHPLVFTMAAGEEGKLFGSVTTADIEEALEKKNIQVDKRKIVLEEPIKTVGTHNVSIKLHTDVIAQLTVVVEAEKKQTETPAVAAEPESPNPSEETPAA